MPKAQSRIPEKSRKYEGEEQATVLVNWLNTTRDSAAKQRIQDVIGTFRALADRRLLDGREAVFGDGTLHVTVTQSMRRHLLRELDRDLRYYTMRPKLDILASGNRGNPIVVVAWAAVAGSELELHERKHALRGNHLSESRAMTSALGLMQSGAILRIEVCLCGKFFYKRFSHQRFCTEKCRIAEFRTGDDARLKRNAYARKLYQLHKQLDSGKAN